MAKKAADPLAEEDLKIRLPSDEEEAIRNWWSPQTWSRSRHKLFPRGPVTWRRRKWERALLVVSYDSPKSVARFCAAVEALLPSDNDAVSFEKAKEAYLAFSCLADHMPGWDPTGTYGEEIEDVKVSTRKVAWLAEDLPEKWSNCPWSGIPLVERLRRERKEAATGARRAFEKAVEAAEATYAERAAPFESARHDAMLLVPKVSDELMTPESPSPQEAIALAQRCRDEAVADAERVYEETVEPAQLALQEARISASAVLERTTAAIQRGLDEKHISAREFEEAMAEADRVYEDAVCPARRNQHDAMTAAQRARDQAVASAESSYKQVAIDAKRLLDEAAVRALQRASDVTAPAERAYRKAVAPFERVCKRAIAAARAEYERTMAGPIFVRREAAAEVAEWDARIQVADRLTKLHRRIEQAIGRFRILDVTESREKISRRKEQARQELGLPKKRPPVAPERGPRAANLDRYRKAVELAEHGTPAKAIARETGASLRTVYRWIEHDQEPHLY